MAHPESTDPMEAEQNMQTAADAVGPGSSVEVKGGTESHDRTIQWIDSMAANATTDSPDLNSTMKPFRNRLPGELHHSPSNIDNDSQADWFSESENFLISDGDEFVDDPPEDQRIKSSRSRKPNRPPKPDTTIPEINLIFRSEYNEISRSLYPPKVLPIKSIGERDWGYPVLSAPSSLRSYARDKTVRKGSRPSVRTTRIEVRGDRRSPAVKSSAKANPVKADANQVAANMDSKTHAIDTSLRPSLKSLTQPIYAIDAVLDESKTKTSQKTNKDYTKVSFPGDGHALDARDQTNPDYQTGSRPPERIRINSPYLLNHVRSVDTKMLAKVTRAFVRPYHLFVKIQDELRVRCLLLQQKCSKTLVDESLPTTEDSTIPDEVDDEVNQYHLKLLQCLLHFIDDYILPRVRYIRGPECKRLYFEDLHYLFQLGDHIVKPAGNKQVCDIQVMKIISIQGVQHRDTASPYSVSISKQLPCVIHCVMIDFNGRQLGPTISRVEIPYFEGEKPVTSLPIFPLHRLVEEELQKPFVQTGLEFIEHKDQHEIRQILVNRGKNFFNMTAGKPMHFNGITVHGEELDCPTIIDFEEAFASHEAQGKWVDGKRLPGWEPQLDNLQGWRPDTGMQGRCIGACCIHDDVYDDSRAESDVTQAYLGDLMLRRDFKLPSLVLQPRWRPEADTEENRIEDHEFLIMPWWAYGFIFRLRKFRRLSVFGLSSIKDQRTRLGFKDEQSSAFPEAFDQLVLPSGHKDMVKSLIAQHFRDKQSPIAKEDQWDIVRGKGKGLVILLRAQISSAIDTKLTFCPYRSPHGAPGVGKTTTAECVADYFKRPLFQLTCGDLGMWAEQVEKALQETFQLASRWGCILLLDEADVFLSARTPTDLLRNSLVSVFLRVMEYYSGILFLTTNRVGDFDEAFASRIHMSLYYPPLDLQATTSILDMNLGRLQRRFDSRNVKLNIAKTNILVSATSHWHNYPEARWNGRQIRNACQTALALAEFEAQGGNHEAVLDPDAVVNLDVKHFETVTQSYLGFMQYLTDIYGVNFDERAKDNFLRATNRASHADEGPSPLLVPRQPPSNLSSQTFNRNPRTWNPATNASSGSSFQPPYAQPSIVPLQQNVSSSIRPEHAPSHIHAHQMNHVPPTGFFQSPFGADPRLHAANYTQSAQSGISQTAAPLQQTVPMYSQGIGTILPQISSPPAASSSQPPSYPATAQVWTHPSQTSSMHRFARPANTGDTDTGQGMP
ncbi:hypothetical protein F5Y18DRAFT_424012 [Xylariaceae sp. FL1019]|nr:hypothetical protein F5Y18DRAFT_424012 [Xylariaceae sp. FL1019]